jgi:hypothetical protein
MWEDEEEDVEGKVCDGTGLIFHDGVVRPIAV